MYNQYVSNKDLVTSIFGRAVSSVSTIEGSVSQIGDYSVVRQGPCCAVFRGTKLICLTPSDELVQAAASASDECTATLRPGNAESEALALAAITVRNMVNGVTESEYER